MPYCRCVCLAFALHTRYIKPTHHQPRRPTGITGIEVCPRWRLEAHGTVHAIGTEDTPLADQLDAGSRMSCSATEDTPPVHPGPKVILDSSVVYLARITDESTPIARRSVAFRIIVWSFASRRGKLARPRNRIDSSPSGLWSLQVRGGDWRGREEKWRKTGVSEERVT